MFHAARRWRTLPAAARQVGAAWPRTSLECYVSVHDAIRAATQHMSVDLSRRMIRANGQETTQAPTRLDFSKKKKKKKKRIRGEDVPESHCVAVRQGERTTFSALALANKLARSTRSPSCAGHAGNDRCGHLGSMVQFARWSVSSCVHIGCASRLGRPAVPGQDCHLLGTGACARGGRLERLDKHDRPQPLPNAGKGPGGHSSDRC